MIQERFTGVCSATEENGVAFAPYNRRGKESDSGLVNLERQVISWVTHTSEQNTIEPKVDEVRSGRKYYLSLTRLAADIGYGK